MPSLVQTAFETLRSARMRIGAAVGRTTPALPFTWDGRISDHWTPEDWKSFDTAVTTALKNDDHRGLAIIGCSMIEDRLRWLIEGKFTRDLSAAKKRYIFEGRGSLSTLGAKIDMANALGILEDNFRNELKLLAIIRNRCAHGFGHARLTDPDVAKLLDQLKLYNEEQMPADVVADPIKRLGWHFIVAMTTIIATGQFLYAASSVSPSSGMGPEGEGVREPVPHENQ